VLALKSTPLCKISFSDIKKETKQSFILFIQSSNDVLMTTGSTYFLSILSTAEQVGYFGTAERTISLGLSLLVPANQILMPTVIHRMTHFPDAVASLVRKSVLLEVVFGVAALLGGALLAPLVIPLVLGKAFEGSVLPFQLMLCMFPLAAFAHAFGNYVLIPNRKEKLLVISLMSGNVLNLVFIFLLSPSWGGEGAATARIIGEATSCLVLTFIGIRNHLIQPMFTGSLQQKLSRKAPPPDRSSAQSCDRPVLVKGDPLHEGTLE
jgi:O-antigen/teichoic acid export membrane protein